MKKVLTLLLAALALSLPARADRVLKAFTEKVASACVSFEYTWRTVDDVPMTGAGKAMLQGDAFRVEGNGIEMACDGHTRWSADPAAKEMVLETVDGALDVAGNPVLLITRLEEVFTVSDAGQSTFRGKTLHTVALTPRVACGMSLVKLYFLPDGGLRGVRVVATDGTQTEFALSGWTFAQRRDLSAFSYDMSTLDNSWVISDLR